MGLTSEFSALESLSLINVGLTSLKGFPKLSSLKKVPQIVNPFFFCFFFLLQILIIFLLLYHAVGVERQSDFGRFKFA